MVWGWQDCKIALFILMNSDIMNNNGGLNIAHAMLNMVGGIKLNRE